MDSNGSGNSTTFQFVRPHTTEEVFSLCREYGPDVCLLSGGTDLLVRLRSGRVTPRVVVDLKRVESLRKDIGEEESFYRIGALAVMADIIKDRRISSRYPALTEAAATVGSVQIRNRATLAGNICNASPAADTVPALLVYDTSLVVLGPRGSRIVPLAQFFVGPGKTVLEQDEIVAEIRLPRELKPSGSAFERLTRRRGVDLATINVCCMVDADGGTRFAYGAVAPRPILAADESGVLSRQNVGREEQEAAIARLIERTSPISDVRAGRDYRLAMLRVLSMRALETAKRRLRQLEQGD
jgi:CO/xanthine dehydrogenase FAD-binding subunit